MSYQQLNQQTVVEYLAAQTELTDFFNDFKQLEVTEIGDGNVNFVYRVTEPASQKSLIVKQAVPFLRCVGESFPLTRHRINFEIQALQIAKNYCPAHVPTIYHSSTEQSLIVMQDLAEHKILRGEMIKGQKFPLFADHISSYLATTLFYTSDLFMPSIDKKAQVKHFINDSLCKLTEDFVFSHPYEDHASNVYNPQLPQQVIDKVQKDPAVKIAVAQMRDKFKTQAQALIHGDLHIGSIMANQKDTYVIDAEFAFYGPMGFDLGALIGNLYMSYFSHAYEQYIHAEQSQQYRQWLLDTIAEIWQQFAVKFKKVWLANELQSSPTQLGSQQWLFPEGEQALNSYIDQYLQALFSDTIGFAACKMMRRVLGLAKVADFADIADLDARAKIETYIIAHATEMIVNRHNYADIQSLNRQAQRICQ